MAVWYSERDVGLVGAPRAVESPVRWLNINCGRKDEHLAYPSILSIARIDDYSRRRHRSGAVACPIDATLALRSRRVTGPHAYGRRRSRVHWLV